MIKLKELISEVFPKNDEWYHGSSSGDLRGGPTGLHLGTYSAAKQALEATIGAPSEGEWDGNREYGKTLLSGKKRLKEKGISQTGFNCDIPDEDFYPSTELDAVKRWSKERNYNHSLINKPSIKKYKLLCPIYNKKPYKDSYANSLMARLKRTEKTTRVAFQYINDGEDYGSISLVVPDGSCIEAVR